MRILNPKEVIALKEYLQRIIGRPIAFDKQKTIYGKSKLPLWCEEWELIEMVKYLFQGKELYYRDPPPNRLKNSTLWSKEAIEEKVEKELGNMETVNQMIEYFENKRNKFNEIS